ncbi:helix-turn-helix domain-containing protein [Nonomuraea sp. NPDC050643]|uniref:winged helix-turn-helix transcriptional regulator n=1 Tax=Nonomuraea sp. NPDC050643 TaxID=3155660 RepID=UPI0033FB8408
MDTGDVFDPNCPTRVVLDRIGDKWSVLVLLCLVGGPMRFTQLRTRIGGVTPKVLTQTLRAMEQDGLLTREVFAEVPPRVEYTLTELGRSLHEPVSVVASWAERNVGEILRCREKFS